METAFTVLKIKTSRYENDCAHFASLVKDFLEERETGLYTQEKTNERDYRT